MGKSSIIWPSSLIFNVHLLGIVLPHLTKQGAIETSNITLTVGRIKDWDKEIIASVTWHWQALVEAIK